MEYADFIKSKEYRLEASGFDVKLEELNDKLFDHQKAVVRWALKKGRAAIFAGTGLGKTFMQVEWARQITQRTGNRVLIVAPLCVAQQTVEEAGKLGYHIEYVREFDKNNHNTHIFITNYEMLEKFEWAFENNYFDGIVLDESSIIKHQDSKTRNYVIQLTKHIPYKLSATATPSPNDYMELGNQAEFLGVMSMVEMLATFFIHDSGETSKWRLKGHGERVFWKWLASWAVMFNKPSDLGFKDDGYILPPLEITEIVVPSVHKIEDNSSLSGRNEARRLSIMERVEYAKNLVNADDDQWLIWCNLNDESKHLTASINDAVEVKGSDKIAHKESRMNGFTTGEVKRLTTKPSIAGFGMNWQHCSKMIFVGLNDSYEQLYQAIRRCYRFGQTKSVKVYLVTSELEGPVRDNLLEKEQKSLAMQEAMIAQMKDFTKKEVTSLVTEKTEYIPEVEMIYPAFLGAA